MRKMKMQHLFTVILVFSSALLLRAQSPYEALRYSDNTFLGTSRGRGLAGAFGALGGDFTAIGVNPGGIGVFRKSEIVITVGLQGKTNFSGYGNTDTDDTRFRPNVPNVGFIYTKLFEDEQGKPQKGKFRSFHFAAGINRIADFNEHRYWESNDAQRSLLPALADELSGIGPNQIGFSNVSTETALAWEAFLLNPIATDTLNYTSVTDNRSVTQQISSESEGGINEISMTFGGNYNDKLYFGVYLGVPVLRYSEEINHTELDQGNDYTGFANFELNQRLSTEGVGFNARIGMIYRVNQYFRLGASIHSPKVYGLRDEFSSEISSNLDTVSYAAESPEGEFDYSLTTPWRATASMAVFFAKYGFLTLDYEYVDYSKANYFLDNTFSSFENQLNQDIENIATNAHNVRAGLEFAIGLFRIRGGYAIYGSSLSGENFMGLNSWQMASGGFGFRFKKAYIDFAYTRQIYNEKLNVLFNGVRSTDRVVRNMATFTTGFRF